jgi:hypothetical protein
MTPEQLYSTLLLMYPSSFRRAYADEMLDAFRHLQRNRRCSVAGFWLFILADTSRSALSVHINAYRIGPRRFALEWTGACACGAVFTALLANALTSGFSYLYHPYLEGVMLPPWSYGGLLGLGLGAAQVALMPRRFHLGMGWVIASTCGTALGLELSIAIAKNGGPIGYGIVLGGIVGGSQWALLRTRIRHVTWSVLATTVALFMVTFSCAVKMQTMFVGIDPLSHDPLAIQAGATDATTSFLARGLYGPTTPAELAVEFATMAICGLIMAMLTTKPLSVIHGHQEES